MSDARKIRMTLPETIVFPWLGISVPVEAHPDDVTGEENIALANMNQWTHELKTKLELACYADYLRKIEAVDAEPPTVPVISTPSDIWKHVEVVSVRPEGRSHVIVYAVPAWSDTLHHEWCIEGVDRLVYVGQFLHYSAQAYLEITEDNSARGYEEVIARLGHVPRAWINK